MTEEIWKVVEGYDFPYEVSDKGRVKGPRGVLCAHDNGTSLIITLRKNGKSCSATVKRLVALAFVPNPHNHLYVRTKNGNFQDVAPDNLEWFTDHIPKERMTKKRAAVSKVEKCPKNCIHAGVCDTMPCCDYIFNVGKPRPCPPGKNCTEYKKREKPRKHQWREDV